MSELVGKWSWFGGPHDAEDSGHTASGGTTHEPGIAVYNHKTLGGYWRVTGPNGKTVILKQTDIGPAPWTGRKIDVTYSALKQFGYHEGNFPTDAVSHAEYLGRNPASAKAVAARQAPKIRQGDTETVHTDRAGLEQAQRQARNVAGLFPGDRPGDVLLREALEKAGQEPVEAKPVKSIIQTDNGTFHVPAGSNPTNLEGVADFHGKKVAAWIAPILHYVEAHGVKPEVTSGHRTRADQQRIWDSGVRPAARPGTSNHEFTVFPGGAVDIANAQQVARVLAHSPYAHLLVYAGAKDPVHFSHPHNGSY